MLHSFIPCSDMTENPHPTLLILLVAIVIIGLTVGFVFWVWFFMFLIIIGFFFSFLGFIIHKAWMGISRLLSFITPNILLSVVFFLVLTPIALLRRLLTSFDPFGRQNHDKSTFHHVSRKATAEYFRKPW